MICPGQPALIFLCIKISEIAYVHNFSDENHRGHLALEVYMSRSTSAHLI